MEEVAVERYAGLIMEWTRSVDTPEDVGRCFEKFCLKASQFAGLGGVMVCFDERAAQSIMQLLDTLKLQSFHASLHPCKQRETLGTVGEELYCQGFISKRHRLHIREKIQQCMLTSRIEPFLRQINQLSTASMHEIRLLWNHHIVFEIEDFWLWIISCNIKHQALILIFEVTVKMNQKLCPQILQSALFREIRSMYESSSMDKTFSTDGTQPNSPSLSNKQDMSTVLEGIAVASSLALNKNYSQIGKSINEFVADLNTTLFPRRQQYFELFGSVRSKMGLLHDYDIDLTVIFAKERKINYSQPIKANDLNFLEELQASLEQQDFPWLISTYLGTSAPFAYLKLSLDPSSLLHLYRIPQLTKIDITVDGKNTIINSQFIARFAQIREVLIFCLLAKQWAKNVGIINSVSPMQGLSGYGLVLMCLFFLMHTKQIEFLSTLSNFTAKVCGFKNLYQSLQQFFQFYGEDGCFHKQKMTVCLLKTPQRFIYDKELIINMYDPLDNSNPGRLTIQYRPKFYHQFRRAQRAFQERNDQLIEKLFRGQGKR